jgi:phage gpG-like protein
VFVLKFSVAGQDQVLRTFSRWTEGLSDFSPALEDIADDFLKLEQTQFAGEGKSGSGGWKALSPDYAAWKAVNYPGAKILERDGWLRDSLTVKDAPFQIREITATQAELGTSVSYGIYHQMGTRKMPARPPVELSASDQNRWGKLVHEFLYAAAKSVY